MTTDPATPPLDYVRCFRSQQLPRHPSHLHHRPRFERLSPNQLASFLCVWARLPLHLGEVGFDLHCTDWTPGAT